MNGRRHTTVFALRVDLKVVTVTTCLVAVLLHPRSIAAQSASPVHASPDRWSVDSLDMSVDPCVDFYQFACGGWQKRNPLPADRSDWEATTKMAERNLATVRGILEKASLDSAPRSSLEARTGDFYHACMDASTIEQKALGPLRPELDRIERVTRKDKLPAAIAHMHQLGMRALSQIYTPGRGKVLFDFRAEPDDKNAAEILPVIDAAGIGLPDREYYIREDADAKALREKYIQHIQNMFVLLGETNETALGDARAAFAIEKGLASHSLGPTERRDPAKIYHILTFGELQRRTPAFSWRLYAEGIGLSELKTVNARELDFLNGMQHTLESHSTAEWRAYLRWHLVHYSADMLPKAFSAETFDFFGHTLSGEKIQRPRWNTCVNATQAALGEVVGELFVQRTFSQLTKQRLTAMVSQIENILAKRLSENDWMSEDTKREALKKLQSILVRIA